MSLFSRVKNWGTSVGVITKLKGKTWDLLENEEKVTYIFKSDNEVICVLNGKSATVRYNFIPDSNTLIIFYGISGISYHIKHVDDSSLILVDEEDDEDLCFANRSCKNPPTNETEAYKQYFAKHIEYIQRNTQNHPDWMTSYVDKVTEGLDDRDKILLVDTLRNFLDGFNYHYVMYLGYYCKTHDKNFDADEIYKSVGKYFNFQSQSETLDNYIMKTEDHILKYRFN